jgi:SWI/SNF-related matrix-associated actin-dependent regulator of chromatin subfamily A-like protein 1
MTKPILYQKECALEIEAFDGRALVTLEPGLGKSFTGLLWAKWNPDARPIIIVCPPSLKWNWQRECKQHFGWDSRILVGTKPPAWGLSKQHSVIIIGYNIVGPWLSQLQSLNPQLVIGDEIQAIKERSSKAYKNFKKLCEGVPYILGLSGTPAMNRPRELYNILNILRPDEFRYARPFYDKFCKPRLTPWGWNYDGAENLSELNQTLKRTCMVRRRKSDVLKQLPPKRFMTVSLDFDREEYDKAEQDFIAWLSKINLQRARNAARNQAMAKVGYMLRLAADLKLNSVMDWIDSFLDDGEEKMNLFAIHKKVIGRLRERYDDISVVIDGSTPTKDRLKLVDRFQRHKRTRLMIGNIEAAGRGLNMTAAASVGMVELPWRPSDVAQAVDRSHRIGQLQQVDCYFLVAHGTIEDKLCDILRRKEKILSSILDGKEYKELDVLDTLLQSYGEGGNHEQSKKRRNL